MAIDHSVSVQDVRTELNGLPEDVVGNATIQQKINHAAIIVRQYAGDTTALDSDYVDYAVAVVAAHDVLTSDSTNLVERASELDITEEYNIEKMANTKAAKRKEALALVTPDAGAPSLAALGNRYQDR